MNNEHVEHENLVSALNNEDALSEYKTPLDGYRLHPIPKAFGEMLIWFGNTIYGKGPSYLKFRAIEVIARVPYHSWSSAIFTLLTLFYTDEKRALKLSKISEFVRFASDNETMHVVVISTLAARESTAGILKHTIMPMLFAFLYFWIAYMLYLINPKWSLEINYLFEQHAFDQYSQFIKENEEFLKKKPVESEYLILYGRNPINQYDFFKSVRNDEIIHRNRSIREINLHMR